MGRTVIDIEKILTGRMKGRKPPRFLVSFLTRWLQVDFLNWLLDCECEGMAAVEHIIKKLNVTVTIEGLENVPDDGRRYVFASNHPLGGIDGVLLLSTIAKHLHTDTVKTPANDFLLYLYPINSMFIPVSKTGRQSRELSRLTDELYGGNFPVLIFPAGLCSRRQNGQIQDLPWKKTFIQKSVEFGRWVVPVHFIGENSRRFYNFASLCKKLRFKFNFAMTLLPDEVYKGQNKNYKIVFGKPIPPVAFDSSKTALQWAEQLRQEIYRM